MKKEGKKAQQSIGMSFSVIFSIIIIIFIVLTAFFVIKHFLNTGNCTKIGLFTKDLQEAINKARASGKYSANFEQILPTSLEYVCFADLSKKISSNKLQRKIYEDIKFYEGYDANMYLYPSKNSCEFPYLKLKYINITEITKHQNPYCIKVISGNVKIKIEKGFRDRQIKLS